MGGGIAKAALLALLAAPVARPALAETVIAALGDSLTQGYGLPQDQGFVPQMQAWLDERDADVQVINAGVSGDTTAGGLARVEWTLTDEVEGMIVALGGNDLLRGIDPATARANLEAILEAAAARGVPVLLVGMTAPGNYGAEYKAAFDAIYPELAEAHGVLLAEDFLGPLTSIADRQDTVERYMQGDGIHPNADGVSLIVEALGPEVLRLVEQAEAGSQ